MIIEDEDPLPVEIDGLPPCNQRLVKNAIHNSKHKVYDRLNVSVKDNDVLKLIS